MSYTSLDDISLTKLKQIVIAQLMSEIDLADEDGKLEEFLQKHEIVVERSDYLPVDTRRHSIIVLGALAGRENDYKMAAKKMGINPDNIIFESDYTKLKNFDAGKLEDSQYYSDIIYGPNPHMQVNIEGFNSLLSMINANPARFPRVIEARTSSLDSRLKITISGFKNCLLKTRYYESIR